MMVNAKKWMAFSLIAGVCCVQLCLSFFSQKTDFFSIPPLLAQKTNCSTSQQTNTESLVIYVTDEEIGKAVADYLCESATTAKQYGSISLITGQSDYDTYRYISYGLVDLALIKDNIVSAFNATKAHSLQPIASYADYDAFFIALHEKPVLSKDYFLDKRIGLLDYPSSRSGYIAPKSAFHSLDLNEPALSLNYYNSHSELREHLLMGDVDVIATYWDKEDEAKFSSSYKTKIQHSVSGVRWYLKHANKNPDLRCDVEKAISKAASKQDSSYYSRVQWDSSPCNIELSRRSS